MKTSFPMVVLMLLQVVLFAPTEAYLGSNEWTLTENQDHAGVAELERNIQHDGGILSIWLDKVAASESQPAEVAPFSSEEISKLWSVCTQCSNAQIEDCLLTTAMDAPSKIYDPSSDIFHAADTYDCLVSTISCCAE
jgi:hypothetical protein